MRDRTCKKIKKNKEKEREREREREGQESSSETEKGREFRGSRGRPVIRLTRLHCRWTVETLIDLFISLPPDRGASPGREEGMARVEIARESERERERGSEGGEVVRVRDTGEETVLARVFRHPFPRSLPPSRSSHRPIEIVPPEVGESL